MQLTFPALPERRHLSLSRELINWLLCWIVLPNLAFTAIWIVGNPPRHPEIIATGTIGLLVRNASFPVKCTSFLIALTYSVLSFISALFNLSIVSLIKSFGFLVELRPAASMEYVILALLLLGTLAAATRMLRLPTGFNGAWQVACAAALLMGFATFDLGMSTGNRGSYKRIAPEGAAFSSGTDQTDLAALATGERHLMIVMVEAMGLPRDAALREKLVARWRRSDIGALYEVETGSTPYYGSTTNGEVRELCGRWGDYQDYMESFHGECLPARLADRGYETTAIHSFDGSFFERTAWYPNVGFQSWMFRDELVARGAAKCPGVFPGACDRDVPAIIAERLKQSDQPQFIYWLTVNTHLPVPVDEALGTGDCARYDPALADAHPMTCRLFSLWSKVSDGIGRLLTDADLPPTDVLIVGDHAPPFFDREERAQFHAERVPWILLKRKNVAAVTPAAPAAPTAGRPHE